jgi:hypothetical protein
MRLSEDTAVSAGIARAIVLRVRMPVLVAGSSIAAPSR